MANWKNIHPDFTIELQKEWEKKGFNYEETEKWINIVGLLPKGAEFAQWLKIRLINLTDPKTVLNYKGNLADLEIFLWEEYEKEHNKQKWKKIEKDQIFLNLNYWGNIHIDFEKRGEGMKNDQQLWEKRSFDYKQCKKWIDACLGIDDADYAYWLRDIKKLTPECFLDYENKSKRNLRKEYRQYIKGLKISPEVIHQIMIFEKLHYDQLTSEQQSLISNYLYYHYDFLNPQQKLLIESLISNQELKERYRFFGTCKECYQPNANSGWCQFCDIKNLQKNFSKWTSGDLVIDKFIQEHQLETGDRLKMLHWIPYEQFADIKYLTQGGFSKVYKAEWKGGIISDHQGIGLTNNYRNGKWADSSQGVILKVLNNSQNITTNFLQEIANHKLFKDNNSNVVDCYGISQDPKTKDYLIVMDYVEGGDLKQFLSNKQLKFYEKLGELFSIAEGLEEIHRQNLIHRDFHSGNILKNGSWSCKITDLGLCRPASETNEAKVYGILPYIAPEILKELFKDERLRKIEYTQDYDVYSWGMIAYEVLSGKPPYYEFAHDESLALKILKGLRPNLEEVLAAQLLKDLIRKCWNADPNKRPTAREIEKVLWVWWRWSYCKKDPEFCQQLEEIRGVEELNKLSPMITNELTYKNHPQAIYTSRLLDFSKSKNNSSQEWQTTTLLELQIKSTKSELEFFKQSLNSELKELVDNFIPLKKNALKDKDNKEIRDKAWELEEKLENEGLVTQDIEKLIKVCEIMANLELEQQQTETEQFQEAQMEIPSK